MADQPSANDLRDEIRDRTKDWESADLHSRREHEAAEAATRAFAELDAGLTDGTMDLPSAWEAASLHLADWGMIVATRDIERLLPRVEDQVTLTPIERAAVERLQAAVRERKR